jgi:transposase
MEVLYQRCCGLDVHKAVVAACIITPEGRDIRTFSTMTGDLLKFKEWLLERKVTHVAMESTGVYWKPVYNLLEDSFTVLLANAQHIKRVPGRKTDVKDAEWIAEVMRHGLVRGSFVPDKEQRELRDMVRYRRSLIQERSREVNRIQKLLEGCNIKLSSVASDIAGVSGRAMLEAMVNGIEDPGILANMARGTMRRKKASLEESLRGFLSITQKMMLRKQLEHLDFLDKQIAEMDEEINGRMAKQEKYIELLDTVPGIDRRGAEEILVEIGTDMSLFPTAAHLASWAGICPGNHQSAGKRKSGRARPGNRWFRSTLILAARATTRRSKNYFSALYHRIVVRRGDKRAIFAVAHAIAQTIYAMLLNGTVYQDLGVNYFDERDRQRLIHRSIRRIEALGFKVSLQVA